MKLNRRKFLKFLGVGSVSALVGLDTVSDAEAKSETDYTKNFVTGSTVEIYGMEDSEPAIDDWIKTISEEMYNAIWRLFVDVYSQAIDYKLPTDTIKLFARSEVLEAMGLFDGDTIYITFFNQNYFLPVVADDSLLEIEHGDGGNLSEIRIYSPDWENL